MFLQSFLFLWLTFGVIKVKFSPFDLDILAAMYNRFDSAGQNWPKHTNVSS